MGTIVTPRYAVSSGRYYQAAKRLLDLSFCLVAFPIVIVLSLVIAVGIFLVSRTPHA